MTLQSNPARAEPEPNPAEQTTGDRPWVIALGYLSLSLAALYPVLSVTVPPLVDYPNHLARAYILAEIAELPLLQERYAVTWAIVPNLAMDLIVPPLTAIMSVFDAGRVFIAATLLMLVAGTVALHRVLHGRVGLWPAAIYLLLYNHVLAWGFLNYLFGVGLFLLVFAAWIACERWSLWVRLAVFSLASSVLFFCHLFAFGVYVLTIAAYQLGQTLERHGVWPARLTRDWLAALGQFAVPGLLWLFSQGATGVAPEATGLTFYGTLLSKLRALLSPVFFHWQPLDYLIFGFLCVVLPVLLFGRDLRLAPAVRLPLFALGVAALAMPTWLLNVAGVDFRLPLVVACLAVAGTRPKAHSRDKLVAIGTVALVLFVTRIWTLAEDWRVYDLQFAEFRVASQRIAPGASLLVTRKPDLFVLNGRVVFRRVYSHLPALAVIDRSVFLPSLFTGPQQPIQAASAYAALDTPFDGHALTLENLREGADPGRAKQLEGFVDRRGIKAYWAFWPERFENLLMLDVETAENPFPSLLTPVHQGSFFSLYAVEREAAGSQ